MTATQVLVIYAAAAGVAAFVLSLPVSRTRGGSFLRRLAALCAVIALLPAIMSSVGGIVPSDAREADGSLECNIVLLLGAAVLSLLAWAFLTVRSRLRDGGRRNQRSPMLRRYQHRADNDLLDFLDRFNRDDRDA